MTAEKIEHGKESAIRRWANRLLRFIQRAAAQEKRPAAASAAQEKEKQAERLLNAYGNALLRLAYAYVHNADDAEEILQDTLLRFLQAQPETENTAHEKAWLMKTAANLSKNRIDYNRLRKTDELKEELAEEEREDLSFVWEAVKALPVKYRVVIHLFYQEGYTTGEIASVLHRKEATVRSQLDRGREKLREILKEAYDFE